MVEKKTTKKVENKAEDKNTKKLKDLKIELLKNPTKRKSIKKEIARLLTLDKNKNVEDNK